MASPGGRVAVGMGILILGLVWLGSVHRAETRSSVIQHGRSASAVINNRRLISVCAHYTCNQTQFSVRYPAAGRLWRATVLVDGWDDRHRVGDRLSVVYDPTDPGRVEARGRAPSSIAPAIGAWLCIVSGALVAGAWGHLWWRERSASR